MLLKKSKKRIKDETKTRDRIDTEKILKNFLLQSCIKLLKIKSLKKTDNITRKVKNKLFLNLFIDHVNKQLDINIELKDFLSNPTINHLYDIVKKNIVSNKNFRKVNSITPTKPKPFYALSNAQKRLWILYKLEPNLSFYNISIVRKLSGKLDIDSLNKTIETLIDRHEALRTNIQEKEGTPVQVVRHKSNVKLRIIDLTRKPAKNKLRLEKAIIKASTNQPFKLETDQLIRFKLIKTKTTEQTLIIVVHHIIFDNWSDDIFLKELAKLYSAYSTNQPAYLPILPVQYKDYAEWEQSKENQKRLKQNGKYWLKQLRGELPLLNLPTDKSRTAIQTFNGDTEQILLDKNTTQQLNQLASQTNTTQMVLLFTAFAVFLHKLTGQTDLIVGALAANRDYPELANVIGALFNNLAIRTKLQPDQKFLDLLSRTRQTILDGFTNKDYSFDQLIEKLNPKRDLSRAPIFNVIFQTLYQPTASQTKKTANQLVIKHRAPDYETTVTDLRVLVTEATDQLIIKFQYNTDLFSPDTIKQWLGYFKTLLIHILANPKDKLKDLELITSKEKDYLINDYNDTKADYPKDRTIHQLFEEQVKRTSNNIALIFDRQKLTYQELNNKANQLANYLLKQKTVKQSETKIAVLLNHSPEMIISVLAILKTGSAYVPIDPACPINRIKYMIKDANSPIIITRDRFKSKLSWFKKETIYLNAEDIQNKLSKESPNNPKTRSRSTNLAVIIYTSGSTGRPKGVMLNHKGTINNVYLKIKGFGINSGINTLCLNHSVGFVASIWQIFTPLILGRELMIYSKELTINPTGFFKKSHEDKIDLIEITPKYLEVFLGSNSKNKLNFKTIIITGEKLESNLVHRFLKAYKNIKLFNAYGQSECSDDTLHYKIDRKNAKDLEKIPIGKPAANTQAYILDKNMKLIPPGIPGELYISGDGLTRGYLNQPDKTKQVFLPHPFIEGQRIYKTGDIVNMLPDGNIEYVSRTDHQVKIRGNRVELGEIEANLNKLPQIKQAVVLAKEEKNKNNKATADQYLVAYYISKTKITTEELRNYLKTILPEYMIPGCFIKLDNFPLNSSGKLDRLALPEPDKNQFINQKKRQPPTTSLEKKLVDIWQEVLGIKKVGINDNFFELGGHSLKIITLYNILNKKLKRKITVINLFQFPSISSFSLFLKNKTSVSNDIKTIKSGRKTLSKLYNKVVKR